MVSQLIPRIVSRNLCCGRKRACLRAAVGAALALVVSLPQTALATITRIETSLGGFNVELYDTQAPITVTNFLNYVNRGDYNDLIIHRHATVATSGVDIVQGGGYKCCLLGQLFHIPTDPPIQNEFDPSRSNVRGSIAMAKSLGDPNSATSEWFINVIDNSATLDDINNNGGYTVFGHVLDSGMDVVDAIAALPITTAPVGFTEVPDNNRNFVVEQRICVNNDGDGACPEIEDQAVNPDGSGTGDGNGDGIPDKNQANVTTTLSALDAVVTFATDAGATLEIAGYPLSPDAPTLLAKFSRPSGSQVQFNEGLYTIKVNGTMGSGWIVTVFQGTPTHATHYYAYGPSPGNSSPHWYDFSYDGTTGAEIVGDKIILHFVDGQRGDDDLTINGSVMHTGGPATVTSLDSSTNAAGCAIATTSSRITNHGDWALVSIFIAFVALVRRRARRIK